MRIISHNAFTLLEMIVVVAIIGILLALMVPALAGAKRNSRLVNCAANLRQLGQVIQQYQIENHVLPYAGVMPAPFDKGATYKGPPPGPPLFEALAGYLPRNSKVYRCPGDTNAEAYEVCVKASPVQLGMSYFYWGSVDPRAKTGQHLLHDFMGYADEPLKTPFHPSRASHTEGQYDGKVNALYRDYSVRTF